MKFMRGVSGIHCLSIFVLLVFFSSKGQGQVVQNLTVGGNNEHNNIFWDPFSSASGYIIYWDTLPNVYPNGNQINLGNVIGYSHTGLIAGKRYYYNVVALVGGQASGPSTEVYANPFSEYVAGGDGDGFSMLGTCLADLDGNGLSPAPANFTVASGIEQNVIFWDPVANAVSYTVEVSLSPGGPYSPIGTTLDRYYPDRGLIAGIPYYYIVTANFSGQCSGGTSIEENGTPVSEFILGGDGDGFAFQGTCNSDMDGNTISPAPANFTVASGIEQNILFWDPVANAVSYGVEVSLVQGGPYTVLANTVNRYYVDKGLAAGTTFYYIVTANFSGACAGGTSTESSGTPVPDFNMGGDGDGFAYNGTCTEDLDGNSISPAPANFTVAAGIERNIMYWDPVPNAISYTIDISANSGGPYTNLASTTNRYYVDATAASGNNYYYVVTAVFSGSCGGGVSSESSAIPVADYNAGGDADGFAMSATCNQDLDGNSISITPSNFTIAGSNVQNIMYWDPVSNASTYSIYQSTSSSGPFNLIGSTTNRWYKDENLQADTVYYYQLQVGFSGSCLGGTTATYSATPIAEYVGGGDADGFAYGSSGFFSLLSGPAPIITIQGSSTVCLGDSVTLISSTASTYQWYLNGSVISGAIGKNLFPTVSGNYSVTTNGGSSIAVPIVVNPKPAAFTGPSWHICSGQSANLGSTASLGNTYSWSPGAGLSDSSISNPIATPTASTLYTLTETIVSTGCYKTDTVSVSPSTLTSPLAITGRDTIICAGQAVNLGTSAVSGNSYSWSPSTGLNSDQISNPVANPVSTTSFILTETVTAFGCYKSDTITISVNALPVSIVSSIGSNSFCVGDSVILSAPPANAWLWSNAATTQDIIVYQSGNYSVDITDANTCIGSSAPTVVLANPLPSDSVFASGSLNICQGNSVSLTAFGNGNYLWSDGSSTQSVVLTQSGNYSVQVTDTNGCISNSAVQTINVGSLPTALITAGGSVVFCLGDSVVLSASPSSAYLWSSGETDQNITVKQPGNYTVDVTGSNSCVATSPATSITVNPLPSTSISASGPLRFCQGGSVDLSVPAASTYLWSNGSSIQSVNLTQSGNYFVIITDGNNCTDTSVITQIIVDTLPHTGITASGPLNFCQGDSVILTADTNSSYTWSGGETTQSVKITQVVNYSVSVVGVNGCTASSNTISTGIYALPSSSMTASGPGTFCQGDSIILRSTPANNYTWSNGASTQSVTITQSGNYTVSVTDTNGCVGISPPQVVNVLALPNAGVVASGPLSFCLGDSVILTADTNISYLWSNGATSQSITLKQSGNYTVLVSGANLCTANSSPTAVNANPLPSNQITASGPLTFCQGDSVVLTADSSAAYIWSGGQSTQSVTITQSGNYSVKISSGFSCIDSSAVSTVLVHPLPIANITSSGPLSFCQGDSVTLTASSASTYLWSNGKTTQAITVHTGGNYSVSVGDLNGCFGNSPISTVVVYALPSINVTASGSLTLCQGDSVLLNADPNATYLWSNGATTQSISVTQSGNYSVVLSTSNNCVASSGVSSVQVNSLPTATATASGPVVFCQGGSVSLNASLGASWLWSNAETTQQINAGISGNYSVKVTDANGCSAQSPGIAVTVNALPNASITPSGNQGVCAGDSLLLQSTSASIYLWSTGESTSNIYVSAAGNYSVSLTDANGCKATSAFVSLNIHSLPMASISASGPLTFCQGGQVILSSSTASSYSWTNGATSQSIVVTTAGNYGLNILDSNSCSGSATPVSVTVNALPTPQITAGGPVTFCPGGTVTLTSTSASSYLWSTGSSSQSIVVNLSGSYSVTVTNSQGCTGVSKTIQVSVNPAATATITASGPLSFCQGDSVKLTANSGSTYLWSNGASTQNIVVKSSGSFTVNVTSPLGCFASSQATVVIVNPLPVATISASGSTSFCQGDSLKLTASSASTYAWSNGKTTPSIYVKNSGSYTVTITDGNSCSAKSSPLSIVVNPLPSVSITASGPLSFCPGEFVTLTASAAPSYSWSNGSSSQSVNASYAGIYTVTVKDANTCSASASVTVSIFPTPGIPVISQAGNVLSTSTASAYQWNFEGSPISGATDQMYTATAKGNYTVTITNANGCKTTSDPHYTTIIGIEEISGLFAVSLSPNPFVESFRLIYSLQVKSKMNVILYDASGQLISVLKDETQIPGDYDLEYIGELSSGVYFLRIQIGEKSLMLKVLRTN
jgi:hypothetical protein